MGDNLKQLDDPEVLKIIREGGKLIFHKDDYDFIKSAIKTEGHKQLFEKHVLKDTIGMVEKGKGIACKIDDFFKLYFKD